ncbi:MAG: nucleotidyl transferase AbiEii/AbiGii toxin family protein [Bacteroidales bacterium]|nr:nucleotidyl transferase AbiEii/AbiGii toxin family protein [Bacteroidales bacterium]
MKFIELSQEQRRIVFTQAAARTGINVNLTEKDWWICQVLSALFKLPSARHTSFKGGTSLSKCWKLIDRISEDIDIGIDREYLGFGGTLSKTQISDKLRRAACSFVRDKLQFELHDALINEGIPEDMFKIHVNITSVTTTDPEIIEVEYSSLFETNPYIRNVVRIEVNGRSMSEPVQAVTLKSIIDEVFPDVRWESSTFDVRAVLPERTFLEKIFLLHEEFRKPSENIRVERMSRHMYDIGQILRTPIAERALNDEQLYRQVIQHRKTFIGLRGFDYDTLFPSGLSILPPESVQDAWRYDYEQMRLHMIYGESIPFDALINQLRTLNDHIRQLGYQN